MPGRLAIVAGGGDLPIRLAEHALAAGRDPFVIGIAGFVDPGFVTLHGGVEVSIGEIGKQIDAIRKAACEEVVFAGVVRRPDFASLRLDMKGASVLPRVLAAAGKGDDALLRVVLDVYQEAGFRVVGADDVLADLLAHPGVWGAHAPTEAHWSDIRVAARIAGAIGSLDIGQGAVVCDGLVLAVEAQEGTDRMLSRCGELPEAIRGTPAARRGVLVKRPKPQQERRIDLPTIGPETIRGARAAGLAGVAVEAGAALVLSREKLVADADAAGLFVVGFAAAEVL
jgi:UDP-2,3-diacylglucosamine hydrolase